MAELLEQSPLDARAEIAADAFEAARTLSVALERESFAGWDPYDALASPFLRRVARGRRSRQFVIQALKRAPVNPRPLLAVPKLPHTKALALLTSAHARLACSDGDRRWLRVTGELARRLLDAAVRSDDGIAWGYDFDVQTRWGFYARRRPNAVATAFAIHALLDADAALPDAEFRESANAGLAYAAARLLVDDGGATFFGYYDGASKPIHNASLLVAGACARGAPSGSDAWNAARRAITWSVQRQAPDGSWAYGEAPGLEWVDGYHSAFNLEALALALEREDEPGWRGALNRGISHYRSRLIEPNGTPRASVDSRYPIDIHAAATAVTTLSRLAREDPPLADDAARVLRWTLANLRRADGRFAYQQHRRWRCAVPYIRWSDGHMLLALATFVTEERDGLRHSAD